MPSFSVRSNIIANFVGQLWTTLMGIAFVPLYIHYLGMESYGLIGFLVTLQACMALLDLGLTPALGREMARYTGGAHTGGSIRDILRTLEVCATTIAFVICLIIYLAAPLIAGDWLKAEHMNLVTTTSAVRIMGVLLAFRFLEAFYRGALVGLQHQVWLNGMGALLSTLRSGGVIGIIAFVSPTIMAFFLWQATLTFVGLLVLMFKVKKLLPVADTPPRFSFLSLKSIWRFATGMAATSLLVLFLTQVDKIILSKMLSLTNFGYYTLATTVASGIGLMIGPVGQAYYPKFTALFEEGSKGKLIEAYHRAGQIVSVFAGSAAIVLMLFSKPILAVWTQNEALVAATSPLVVLLACGAMFNGLMVIPYMMQLAHGWTSFAFRVSAIAVVIVVPTLLWIVPRYGAIGAASVWAALNAGYVLISIHFMHRRILSTEKWRWYIQDVTLPLFAAVTVAGIFRLIQPNAMGTGFTLFWLAAVSLGTLSAASLSSSVIRGEIAATLARFSKAV